MEALSASLARLEALVGSLGAIPEPAQLEQLQAGVASALGTVQANAASTAQRQRLWDAAARLWNASIELDAPASADGDEGASADGGDARRRAAAALLQGACDLSRPALAGALPVDQLHAARFHLKAGQVWAQLGELEAAEAVLARGGEAAAALSSLALQPRSRGPLHQDAATVLLQLLLERLRVTLHAGRQQALAADLTGRAAELAADSRLPSSEALALRLSLITALREEGQRLAQAGDPAAAAPLLNAAYEALSQVDMEGEEAGGGLASEVQGVGAQVLTLLAWCGVEMGEPERGLSCLQALRQVAGEASTTHFPAGFLSLRCLLQLGRMGEAENELLNFVAHEEASPEACLAALSAALSAPGGTAIASAALPMVLERFSEDAGLVVELTRAGPKP